MTVSCPQHGEFSIRASSHINQKAGCSKCYHERRSDSSRYSVENYLSRVDNISRVQGYINTNTKCMHTCVEGHSYLRKPTHVLAGHECKLCEYNSRVGGYSKELFDNSPNLKNAPARIYVIKFTNTESGESFVKVGVTKLTILKRFSGHYSKYSLVVLRDKPMTLYQAFTTEQRFLSMYREHKYIPVDRSFGGWTECFKYKETP